VRASVRRPPPGSSRRRGESGSNWLEKLKNLIFGAEPTEMIRPAALAINDERLLVVADPGVPTVHFFDLERRRYDRADDAVAAELVSPVGVALDDQGRAYVADSVQRRIFVLDSEGSLVARLGEGLLERPTGIALDPTRQLLYVVDTLACQVVTLVPGRDVGSVRQGGGPLRAAGRRSGRAERAHLPLGGAGRNARGRRLAQLPGAAVLEGRLTAGGLRSGRRRLG
jgi:hypothetical protein